MYRERGISLITAIFILLILSLLAGYIGHLATSTQSESAMDVNASRSYQAAKAGLEYGAYRAIVVASCTTTSFSPANITGFTVTVVCTTPAVYQEGTTNKTLYQIVATACNQPTGAGVCPNPAPGANYAERQLQMSVINPP